MRIKAHLPTCLPFLFLPILGLLISFLRLSFILFSHFFLFHFPMFYLFLSFLSLFFSFCIVFLSFTSFFLIFSSFSPLQRHKWRLLSRFSSFILSYSLSFILLLFLSPILCFYLSIFSLSFSFCFSHCVFFLILSLFIVTYLFCVSPKLVTHHQLDPVLYKTDDIFGFTGFLVLNKTIFWRNFSALCCFSSQFRCLRPFHWCSRVAGRMSVDGNSTFCCFILPCFCEMVSLWSTQPFIARHSGSWPPD